MLLAPVEEQGGDAVGVHDLHEVAPLVGELLRILERSALEDLSVRLEVIPLVIEEKVTGELTEIIALRPIMTNRRS